MLEAEYHHQMMILATPNPFPATEFVLQVPIPYDNNNDHF